MSVEDQVVRYAAVEGRSVAWASVGSGPPVVVGGWWSSHLGLDWKDARFRRFVGALAAQHRVIRYDRPGCGLSDGSGPAPSSLEDEVAVLAGLVDVIGLEPFSLFGASSGSVTACGYAAELPDMVDRLVLYGCGDLINDYEGIAGQERFRGDLRLLYLARLDPAGRLDQLRMVPLQSRQMRLRRATVEDARWLHRVLRKVSRGLGSQVDLAPDASLLIGR